MANRSWRVTVGHHFLARGLGHIHGGSQFILSELNRLQGVMGGHHSSACHYLDPVRTVLELLAGGFDHIRDTITHRRLGSDAPRGHPIATTPMGRSKIAVPSGL